MKLYFSIIIVATFLLANRSSVQHAKISEDTSVHEILSLLGDDHNPNKLDHSVQGVSAQKGKELVHQGYTTSPNGRKTRRQSKYFTCTACHNTRREDPDLAAPDPQSRLQYVADQNMPFLPATTLYGIVNRTSFYNDDYVKKYGDLTLEAREDIRGSIQLCATECAQGRAMEEWEIESVLAYLWTIDLTLGDLQLSTSEMERIQSSSQSGNKDEEAAKLIKSKYLDRSPAHFTLPIVSREERFDFDGDSDNGKLIYEVSCQHCHYNNLYSFRVLDNEKPTFKKLYNDLKDYHKHSVYEVTRYGTQPLAGKKAYMPFYPLEKMSDQQVKDLTTYIRDRSQS